jgi:hypothetical protein
MTAVVLQAILVSTGLLILGYLLADEFAPRDTGIWMPFALAFPALLIFVLLLMVAHIVSAGEVFERPGLVRVATVATAVTVGVRKLRRGATLSRPTSEVMMMLALLLLAGLVWGSPLARMLPIGHVGDQNLHMGWANQLLNGEPTPTAALTGETPNYYPWLFHALVSFVSCFTSGGRAFDAQAALLLLQISGAVLALYALGRELTGHYVTGIGAALFGAIAGGFGFLALNGPDLIVDPRAHEGAAALRYMGDLLYRRSYNLAFHNLVPVFPRDVAFALTHSYLLLLVMGMKRHDRVLLVGAGVILGLIGLTGAETFLVGLACAMLICAFARHRRPARMPLLIIIPGLLLWALWATPLAANYWRLGGFVDTASSLVRLPPLGILGSWGVASVVGLYGCVKRPDGFSSSASCVIWAFLAAAGGMTLVSSFITTLAGPGFTTLSRAHRYWPLIYLGVALWAAVGLQRLYERWGSSRKATVGGSFLIAALVLPSPLLATIALPNELPPSRLLRASLEGDLSSPLNLLATSKGRPCTAAAPQEIAVTAFAYSGYQFVSFPYSTDDPAGARIRWSDIFEEIVPLEKRLRDNRILLRRSPSSKLWRIVARAYDVDRILTPTSPSSGFPSKSMRPVGHQYGSGTVIIRQRCDD